MRATLSLMFRHIVLFLVWGGCGSSGAGSLPGEDRTDGSFESNLVPSEGGFLEGDVSSEARADDGGRDAVADRPLPGPVSPGVATIGGSIGSVNFTASTAYSTMRHPFMCAGFNGDYESQIGVAVSDHPLCAIVTSVSRDPCSFLAGQRSLHFEVTAVRQGNEMLGPGDYAIGSAMAQVPFASASVLVRDEGCNLAIYNATSGTVTFSLVADTVIAGSIDLVFANGGRLSGTFTAPHCPAAQEAMGKDCEPIPVCVGAPTCRALGDE
jgi:hypothetical protein